MMYSLLHLQHPDYDFSGDGFPNDIAVLELKSALEFSDSINKIEMADEGEGNFAGDKCVISGWGLTNAGKCITFKRTNVLKILYS